ncbi:MAG: autotransporter-associated beta strand repeat-containing protein [Parachlamydiaceae bacterium]|nr:MAG: autotransporter-associated beta strand repeat-containing protein [Parachlamydiaceae bacterium]
MTTGTLQGNATNLPQAGITDNSTLVFDQSTPGTYASNITGTGALVKQGASTLVLTGTNSYAAGTIISAGTLQGNTTSIPASNGVLDNGILVFDQAANGTYSGNITGTGSFVKQNAGTLILSGTNTYAGGTTITGGTLQGSTTNIPSGPVLNNSILIFDQPTTGVFSGPISGTGMLIKQNAGLLILSGANSYTGSTTITGGILQGNTNSIPSGSVIDNATFVLDQNFDGTFGEVFPDQGLF